MATETLGEWILICSHGSASRRNTLFSSVFPLCKCVAQIVFPCFNTAERELYRASNWQADRACKRIAVRGKVEG